MLPVNNQSSDFQFYVLGKSSIEIIYIMGNNLVTTKWLKFHLSEILESNDEYVCMTCGIPIWISMQTKIPAVAWNKSEWNKPWQEVCLHTNSCQQASLCLIGMVLFMHNSECGIEPLAWVGVVHLYVETYSAVLFCLDACSCVLGDDQLCTCEGGKRRFGGNQSF